MLLAKNRVFLGSGGGRACTSRGVLQERRELQVPPRRLGGLHGRLGGGQCRVASQVWRARAVRSRARREIEGRGGAAAEVEAVGRRFCFVLALQQLRGLVSAAAERHPEVNCVTMLLVLVLTFL